MPPCAEHLRLEFRLCATCGEQGGARADRRSLWKCKEIGCTAMLHQGCPVHFSDTGEEAHPQNTVPMDDGAEPGSVPVTSLSSSSSSSSENQSEEARSESEQRKDTSSLPSASSNSSEDLLEQPQDEQLKDSKISSSVAVQEDSGKPCEEVDNTGAVHNVDPAHGAEQRKLPANVTTLASKKPRVAPSSPRAHPMSVVCEYPWCQCTLPRYTSCADCGGGKFHLACALFRYTHETSRKSTTYDAIFANRKDADFPVLCIQCQVTWNVRRIQLPAVKATPLDLKWDEEGVVSSWLLRLSVHYIIHRSVTNPSFLSRRNIVLPGHAT
jgi:hypothetical protein